MSVPRIPAASQALLDQVASGMREHARLAKTVYDAYIEAGFTPDQAFTLLRAKLDETRTPSEQA